jgi:hypothetical protein
MGTFRYDTVVVEMDDRLLAHLQLVIVRKVSRGESFLVSWRGGDGSGRGRTAVWIHPTQSLAFQYATEEDVEINSEWLDALMRSANSDRGLVVTREEDAAPTLDRAAPEAG